VTVDSVVVDACFADTVITAAALATDGAVPAPGNFAGDHVSKDWRHDSQDSKPLKGEMWREPVEYNLTTFVVWGRVGGHVNVET
jgi:hypothetical protein